MKKVKKVLPEAAVKYYLGTMQEGKIINQKEISGETFEATKKHYGITGNPDLFVIGNSRTFFRL